MPLLYPPPRTVFDPPTTLDHFLASPLQFLVRHLYSLGLRLRTPAYQAPPHRKPIRVVCISDTHCWTPSIPTGDLLIHAGDLTDAGTVQELQAQVDWLKSLPHPHKIVIAGNHDSFLDVRSRKSEDVDRSVDWGTIHYLERTSVELTFPSHRGRTLKLYGAPQIPACGGADFAFQYEREEDQWTGTIPRDTDILITHAPPKYHLDLPVSMGCRFLLDEVWRVRPTLHVFGHIHSGHGKQTVFWDEGQRAYERVCARRPRGFWDVTSIAMWLDILRLLTYSVLGVLWRRVWGGVTSGGWIINAALMYQSTGRLGNPVEVVDI
ncbi:MAG: hypothetical protein M1838_003374 [Thelocarpon superellum]|nr:MAG: hypothetical protein M1838_003374 [Thelocarpon superellum]